MCVCACGYFTSCIYYCWIYMEFAQPCVKCLQKPDDHFVLRTGALNTQLEYLKFPVFKGISKCVKRNHPLKYVERQTCCDWPKCVLLLLFGFWPKTHFLHFKHFQRFVIIIFMKLCARCFDDDAWNTFEKFFLHLNFCNISFRTCKELVFPILTHDIQGVKNVFSIIYIGN